MPKAEDTEEKDFGTIQWHEDGTEITISGGRTPAVGDGSRTPSGRWVAQVATGDSVLASRARSQRPSGCLRYMVIR